VTKVGGWRVGVDLKKEKTPATDAEKEKRPYIPEKPLTITSCSASV
jgi:hypothetical protein